MRSLRWILTMLCAVFVSICGCAQPAVMPVTAETVTKPEDSDQIDAAVLWCRGICPEDSQIGYEADWSIHVEDQEQWERLRDKYSLIVDENAIPSFDGYVILVLFMGERTGSLYELTELALLDGMATIGIHEATPGTVNEAELVGCLVRLDTEPLEINSYRDEESVG